MIRKSGLGHTRGKKGGETFANKPIQSIFVCRKALIQRKEPVFKWEINTMEAQAKTKKVASGSKEDLFEQAHRDPALKSELLRDPKAVAEKFKVQLSEVEIEELKKVGSLVELTEEIKFGRLFKRPPIYYPIHIWQIQELTDIFSHLIEVGINVPGPIFYPIDVAKDHGENIVAGNTGGVYLKFHPEWVFYPASLRQLIKERLVQILQAQQQAGR